jgi:hypothetical protein
MPSKKVKKFCRITKFLEQTDKDLYQALDDLCLFGLFRTRGRGITFMYPTNKEYRKKILAHAYSNNPEKAVDMIRSLVLLDFLPTTADFKNKKDDIPNALHKKLEVLTTDSKEVNLKSGHKLVVDKSFITLRDGEPVAVYKLSGKGELPTTGTNATMKYNNAKKTGGYRGGANLTMHSVGKLATCVENLYAKGHRNIYKTVMALIYEYAAKPRKSDANIDIKNIVYNKVCASARASFYNIVAPWSLEKDFNIETMLIESNIIGLIECSDATVGSLINKKGSNYNESLGMLIDACGKVQKRDENRDKMRNTLLSTIHSSTSARTEVLQAYNGDSSRLYKDLLTVYCYLAALNEESNDADYFNHSFRYVMKHIFNHTNSFTESVNETVYNLSIYYNLVKSDAFMYTPVTEIKHIDTEYGDRNGVLPEPTNRQLFTIQFNSAVAKHGGSSDDGTFFGGVIDVL